MPVIRGIDDVEDRQMDVLGERLLDGLRAVDGLCDDPRSGCASSTRRRPERTIG